MSFRHVSLCVAVLTFATVAPVAVERASAQAAVQPAARYRIVNGRTGNCLGQKIDAALSILSQVAWRGEADPCDLAADATQTQRFYIARTDGTFLNGSAPVANTWYTIRPAHEPNRMCLDHIWGGDFRFQACDGGHGQQFQFVAKSGGYWVKSRVLDLVPCMSNLLGSNAVSGEACWSLSGSRILWSLVAEQTNVQVSRHAGVGGDAFFVNHLANNGIDVGNINGYTLAQLRAVMNTAANTPSDYVIYRGQVLNNITLQPEPGFRICTNKVPMSAGRMTGIGGAVHACAYTNEQGRYTLVGLPKNTAITNTLLREGYLQLAMTTRTVHAGGDYEQEYVGTGTDLLGGFAYAQDDRYSYQAGYRTGPYGEMAYTIFLDARAPSDPLFGLASPAMYRNNGASEVTFQVYTDPDGHGVFDTVWPDAEFNDLEGPQNVGDGIPDGMFYADSIENGLAHDLGGWLHAIIDVVVAVAPGLGDLVRDREIPMDWLVETTGWGLATMTHMPPGVYEVEASHPTMDCYATKDAWVASNPHRTRFEVVKDTMGDARWYCIP